MNSGLILIIRNTFLTLLSCFTFAAIFYLKIQKILSLLKHTHKTQKQLSLFRFYLVYLVYLLYFTLLSLLSTITNTKICARWSWGHKEKLCFAGLLEQEEEETTLSQFPKGSI
jgi:hypothetical protein